jgi:hypothetical protein
MQQKLSREYSPQSYKVFGHSDWEHWLDRLARSICGLSGSEFEAAYHRGEIGASGAAKDLGSVLPLIQRLRDRSRTMS